MSASKEKSPSFAFLFAILAVIALFVLVAIPNLIRPRTLSSKYACISVTKQIDGAKATWAVENHKENTDTPAMTDLVGPNAYIRDQLECPAGGKYVIGRVEQMSRCTLLEHFLYASDIQVVNESGLGLGGVQIEVQRTNARLCVLETEGSGHTWFSTNSYIAAPGWSSGRTYLRISTAGYRTEMVPIPEMWPLRVVLKKVSDE